MQFETAFEGLDGPTRTRIERTFSALRERGITPIFVPDRRAALDELLKLMPKGATVAHGSSTTLQEIGFIDHLKNVTPGYRYQNPEWQAEDDPTRRGRIRAKLSVEADYFLGSVQAISETGEVIARGCVGQSSGVLCVRTIPRDLGRGNQQARAHRGGRDPAGARGRLAARVRAGPAGRWHGELHRKARRVRKGAARANDADLGRREPRLLRPPIAS